MNNKFSYNNIEKKYGASTTKGDGKMYKILIVDDEFIERNGIKLLINKYKFELEVAEAENGVDALEYLNVNPVDILFTDIKMPFMDGLQLAKKAKELYPDIKIIVFSAYGEFDYTKMAIKMRVNNYILKPVDVNEFVKGMTEIIDLCEKEKIGKLKNERILHIYKKGIEYEKQNILINLINGVQIDSEFKHRINLTGMDFADKYILMVMIDFRLKFFDTNNKGFKTILDNSINWEYEYVNLNERQSVIFINSFEPLSKESILYFLEKLRKEVLEAYKMYVTIVIGEFVNKIEEISQEFTKIELKRDYKYQLGEDIILFVNSNLSKDTRISIGLHEKQMEKITTDISASNDETNKKAIRNIISIIESNYSEDISLESLAEKVYLSPSYFSYLFKKEIGQSLVKYITSYRLEKAKDLLMNTNMKIIDICEKVGFTNASYFGLTFKNYYGTSPAKFREKVE